jgi:hypothetical protein
MTHFRIGQALEAIDFPASSKAASQASAIRSRRDGPSPAGAGTLRVMPING